MAILHPFLYRGFYLFGRLCCTFLLFVALIGSAFLPSSYSSDMILAKASEELTVSQAIKSGSTYEISSKLTNFALPLALDTQKYITSLENELYSSQGSEPPQTQLDNPIKSTPPKIIQPSIKESLSKNPEPAAPQSPPIPLPPKKLSLTISKIGLNQVSLAYGHPSY
jgi:hypothetical protein